MTVDDLEKAVAQLSPADLAAFRDWFARFDAARWDEQFANDVASGKLDAIADEAIKQHQSGQSSEL
jgi:hypothetical protein